MKNNTISQGVIDMTGRGGIKAFFINIIFNSTATVFFEKVISH